MATFKSIQKRCTTTIALLAFETQRTSAQHADPPLPTVLLILSVEVMDERERPSLSVPGRRDHIATAAVDVITGPEHPLAFAWTADLPEKVTFSQTMMVASRVIHCVLVALGLRKRIVRRRQTPGEIPNGQNHGDDGDGKESTLNPNDGPLRQTGYVVPGRAL